MVRGLTVRRGFKIPRNKGGLVAPKKRMLKKNSSSNGQNKIMNSLLQRNTTLEEKGYKINMKTQIGKKLEDPH